MGTAYTKEAQESVKKIPEWYVEPHLQGGQVIQFGSTYALTNIGIDGILISQSVLFVFMIFHCTY